jgi:MFS family permease
MVMSTCIPYIGKDLGLSKTSMGLAMSAFFAGYTIFQIPGGILVDRFGPRRTMSVAIALWTIFTGLTGMVTNLTQMVIARALFGVGEGPYPAASMKSIALWFEPKRRATATSVILSSNALGPAVAPLLAVATMSLWGWRGTFYCLVIPGIILAVLIAMYVTDDPSAVNGEGARHMDMATMGVVASLPFFAGIVGYLFGGWLSDGRFKDNRKVPVMIFQLVLAALLYLMYTVESMTLLVIYQTLAGFILSAALAATWALPVSAVSKKITGRAVGIFNTGGQLAGLVSPTVIGYLVDVSKGSFDSSFIFMIACILVSSAVALTLGRSTGESD